MMDVGTFTAIASVAGTALASAGAAVKFFLGRSDARIKEATDAAESARKALEDSMKMQISDLTDQVKSLTGRVQTLTDQNTQLSNHIGYLEMVMRANNMNPAPRPVAPFNNPAPADAAAAAAIGGQ